MKVGSNLSKPIKQDPNSSVSRLLALDGFRGLAILIVLFHNTANNGLSYSNIEKATVKAFSLFADSGWFGVQMFFVLSGFLITRILLASRGKQGALKNFYMRRILRIFPLYYLTLIVLFVLLPFIGFQPDWIKGSSEQQFGYWSYLINWFQPFNENSMLDHFWSLAVEEQFYMLWPLVVFGLSPKRLYPLALSLVISAIAVRYLLIESFPDKGSKMAYTFTIARWDALAIGALLALAFMNERAISTLKKWTIPSVIFLGIAALGLFVLHRGFDPTKGALGCITQTVVALSSAVAIFILAKPDMIKIPFLQEIFTLGLLRQLGKYSYAIYIVHVPIKFLWIDNPYWLDPSKFSGYDQFIPMFGNFFAVLIASTLVALVSWHLLENPILKLKRYFPTR